MTAETEKIRRRDRKLQVSKDKKGSKDKKRSKNSKRKYSRSLSSSSDSDSRSYREARKKLRNPNDKKRKRERSLDSIDDHHKKRSKELEKKNPDSVDDRRRKCSKELEKKNTDSNDDHHRKRSKELEKKNPDSVDDRHRKRSKELEKKNTDSLDDRHRKRSKEPKKKKGAEKVSSKRIGKRSSKRSRRRSVDSSSSCSTCSTPSDCSTCYSSESCSTCDSYSSSDGGRDRKHRKLKKSLKTKDKKNGVKSAHSEFHSSSNDRKLPELVSGSFKGFVSSRNEPRGFVEREISHPHLEGDNGSKLCQDAVHLSIDKKANELELSQGSSNSSKENKIDGHADDNKLKAEALELQLRQKALENLIKYRRSQVEMTAMSCKRNESSDHAALAHNKQPGVAVPATNKNHILQHQISTKNQDVGTVVVTCNNTQQSGMQTVCLKENYKQRPMLDRDESSMLDRKENLDVAMAVYDQAEKLTPSVAKETYSSVSIDVLHVNRENEATNLENLSSKNKIPNQQSNGCPSLIIEETSRQIKLNSKEKIAEDIPRSGNEKPTASPSEAENSVFGNEKSGFPYEKKNIQPTSASNYLAIVRHKNGTGTGSEIPSEMEVGRLNKSASASEKQDNQSVLSSDSSSIKKTSNNEELKNDPSRKESEDSSFQKKTMSVMRGGEMVEVSYKVYIPENKGIGAKRRLQR